MAFLLYRKLNAQHYRILLRSNDYFLMRQPEKLSAGYSSSAGESSEGPRKSRFFRKAFMLTVASTGALFAGLYYNESFRDFVTWEIPDSKPIIDKAGEYLGGWYSPTKPVAHTHEFLPFVPEKREEIIKPADQPAMIIPEPEAEIEITPPIADAYPTYEDVMQMRAEDARSCVATDKSIKEAITSAERLVGTSKEALRRLEVATRNHIDGLREAIQSAVDDKTKDRRWNTVAKLVQRKEAAQEQAERLVDEATRGIEVLRSAVDQRCSSSTTNPAAVQSDTVRDGILCLGNLQYDLAGSLFETHKLQNELEMVMRYRDLVAQNHDSLQSDLHSLYEYLRNLGDASSTGEELLTLVSSACDKVSRLQLKLAESEDREKLRLNSALDAQCKSDERLLPELVKRAVDLERSRGELAKYNQSLEFDKVKDKAIQEASVHHSESLSRMLRIKDEEKEHDFAQRMREKLTNERQAFEAALAGWTQRMRAIEEVVDGRAELDRIAKESQALWITCEAFLSSLRSAKPALLTSGTTNPEPWPLADQTGPLDVMVEAVREAASSGNHPFALSLLEHLSDDMVKQGIWMEHGLKRRFEKVYTVCRRVALLDETGGSIWSFALSYINSVLMFESLTSNFLSRYLPKLFKSEDTAAASKDSADDQVSVSKPLDTFYLLRSAKAALDLDDANNASGDNLWLSAMTDDDGQPIIAGAHAITPEDGIELAVRLLGQLKGQARLVAADWLEDARRYLEAKQIAHALLAYAAARGVSTYQKRL